IKTNYDHITLFSPEGQVIPLTNIKRAVELGNTCVGIRNARVGVIVAHAGKINSNEYRPKKIFKIGTCMFSFSGITNDGLKIVEYLNRQHLHDQDLDIKAHPIHIFDDLAVEASRRTIINSERLFGCAGMFCCANSEVRMSLFEPNGSVTEVRATAIGNRSQAAKTVLENEIDRVEDMSEDDVIRLGISALKNTHSDEEVYPENVEIWVLKKDSEPEVVDSRNYF
ncbi:putative proteasome subunit alpha type-6, partial [Dictyocoela roeselum]